MLNRAEIIQAVVNALNARTYLEIGVAHAETLLRVRAATRIGIDPARPSPNIVHAATGVLSDAFGDLGRALAFLGLAPLVAGIVLAPFLPESARRPLDEVSPTEPEPAPA